MLLSGRGIKILKSSSTLEKWADQLRRDAVHGTKLFLVIISAASQMKDSESLGKARPLGTDLYSQIVRRLRKED